MVPENKFQMICLRGTSVIEQKAEISIIDKSRDITPQRKKTNIQLSLPRMIHGFTYKFQFIS